VISDSKQNEKLCFALQKTGQNKLKNLDLKQFNQRRCTQEVSAVMGVDIPEKIL
jgi:hypothetical protein